MCLLGTLVAYCNACLFTAPDDVNVNLRGQTPIALRMRLVEGRWFQRGTRQVVAGRSVAARLPASGSKIVFVRAHDEVARQPLVNSLPEDRRLNGDTVLELGYSMRQTPPGVTVRDMAAGVAFAIVAGVVGGLFPAAAAARKQILATLRAV